MCLPNALGAATGIFKPSTMMNALGMGAPKIPDPVAPPPAPQPSRQPDVAAVMAANAGGAGGGIPGGGVTSTMLTGPGGIDLSMLKLGRNTLLGS